MAKESGLGWTTLSVDDSGGTARDIRNDITNFSFSCPRAEYDWTGIDKSARERGLGLADFSIELSGIFNDAASTGIHTVLKTVTSTSVNRTVSLGVSGQTLANECVGLNYDLERGNDGNLTVACTLSLADGTVPTWS